jgi:transcriptional regulator with XRE-family HTH domain
MRAKDSGAALRRGRKRKRFSQRELGFISGCSHAFIGQLERDESTVSPELAAQIAFRLEVDVEDIFEEHSLSVTRTTPTANVVGSRHGTRQHRHVSEPSVTPEVA